MFYSIIRPTWQHAQVQTLKELLNRFHTSSLKRTVLKELIHVNESLFVWCDVSAHTRNICAGVLQVHKQHVTRPKKYSYYPLLKPVSTILHAHAQKQQSRQVKLVGLVVKFRISLCCTILHKSQYTHTHTVALAKLCCFCDSACQTLYVGRLPCFDLQPLRDTVLPFSLFWESSCYWSDVICSQPSPPCTELEDTQNFSCPLSTVFQLHSVLFECSTTCFECVTWLCNTCLFSFSYSKCM